MPLKNMLTRTMTPTFAGVVKLQRVTVLGACKLDNSAPLFACPNLNVLTASWVGVGEGLGEGAGLGVGEVVGVGVREAFGVGVGEVVAVGVGKVVGVGVG